MKIKLSNKLTLLSRFVFTLLNLYLVGYMLFADNLMISIIALTVFAYLLIKTAIMIMYIQWRMDNNWKDEWTQDEFNAWDEWKE